MQWRNTQYVEHVPDSPNERWALGGSSMTRTFDLLDGSFKARVQAALDIYGYAQVLPAVGQPTLPYYISRVTPMPAPALPAARPSGVCRAVSMRSMAAATAWAAPTT